MYKAFFHLKRNPFEVSPDPYFVYSTPSHVEAFAGEAPDTSQASRNVSPSTVEPELGKTSAPVSNRRYPKVSVQPQSEVRS